MGDQFLPSAIPASAFPMKKMDLLFKVFSQIDATRTRAQGGTGLGLAISKRLGPTHGRIDLGHERGRARVSTFLFTIRAPSSGARRKETLGRQPGRTPPARRGRQRKPNLSILALHTQRWGMEVKACASGEEALARLQAGEKFRRGSDRHDQCPGWTAWNSPRPCAKSPNAKKNARDPAQLRRYG